MTRDGTTTLRPCIVLTCQHGASAHKVRQWDYVPYRAECEHCDCRRYKDPYVTAAATYDDGGNRIKAVAILGNDAVPDPLPLRRYKFKDAVSRRDYWRRKQQECRDRRRIAGLEPAGKL